MNEISLVQVQASLAANTFAVTGHAENKRKHFRNSSMPLDLIACIAPKGFQQTKF